MRILKNRNLFGLLFACLLAIPFFDIAVRCIYVQSNKNAKDSYSDTSEVTDYTAVNPNDLVFNKTYIFVKDFDTAYTGTMTINCDCILLYQSNQNPVEVTDYHKITINNLGVTLTQQGQPTIYAYYNNNYYRVDFVYYTTISNTLDLTEGFYRKDTIRQANNLDNAFEYSVNQFITNNNFGKLDFFNWFNNLFFDNNAKANQYMQFANWYMNYALYISLGYILFLVLMWFVNFVRKLLDRGMSFGDGGAF